MTGKLFHLLIGAALSTALCFLVVTKMHQYQCAEIGGMIVDGACLNRDFHELYFVLSPSTVLLLIVGAVLLTLLVAYLLERFRR